MVVSGTVGGESSAGDTVTLTVDGANYTGRCRREVFSINVPGLGAAGRHGGQRERGSRDAAGNVGSGADTQVYTVDMRAPAPTITLNAVTGDNIVNAGEAGGTLAVTGTVGGDASLGDTVTLTVDGTNTWVRCWRAILDRTCPGRTWRPRR